MLTGASGYLGQQLLQEMQQRGLDVVCAGRQPGQLLLDLAQPDALPAAVAATGARYLCNAAAMSAMAACQAEPLLATKVNAKAPKAMATCADVRMLQVSTDLVFAGDQAPYASTALPRPLSVYGMSKAKGEDLPRDRCLVVRIPLLFGPSFDGGRGATDMLRKAVQEKRRLNLYRNEYRSPLHVADAARLLVDLLLTDDLCGVQHLAGVESLSRWQLALRFAKASGLSMDYFDEGKCEDPRRPKDVSLVSDVSVGRSLDAALADS